MSLLISKECELSSDPNWKITVEKEGYFYGRFEIPKKGDRIILAIAGNPRFFSRLAEFGHVFEVEPKEGSLYTTDGTDGMSERFMRRATADENRRALMTVDGESDTLEFIDHNGFLGELSIEFVKEPSTFLEDSQV
jgi:hypothetical protein